jgi:hypothetical protein
VARHIDNSQSVLAYLKFGESQFDGDSAPLFLGQTIRIGAGKRLYQGSFAVVNVSGGSKN